MPPQDATAKLSFLHEAGLATAASIPSTSAYIHATHNRIASVSSVALSGNGGRQTCPHCGHQVPPNAFDQPVRIAIPSKRPTKASKRRSRATKLKGLPTSNMESPKSIECNRCGRKLRDPAKVQLPRSSKATERKLTTTRRPSHLTISGPDATSRKNTQSAVAKPSARKLKSPNPGLQNLLAQAKQASQGKDKQALSLMDFRKAG